MIPEPRLEDATTLAPGDVVMVAVQMIDRTTRQPYWWKRFCCVLDVSSYRYVRLLTLKMQIDEDRDMREVDVEKDVVTFVPEERWPQGVIAMRMKWITLGRIKL